jgi:hypothetical protein
MCVCACVCVCVCVLCVLNVELDLYGGDSCTYMFIQRFTSPTINYFA